MEVIDSTLNPISVEYTFNVVEACKYGYINLQFMNRFGQWDNVIFKGAQHNSFTVDKTEAMFSPLSLDNSSEFVFSKHKGQFHDIAMNGREAMTINTGWLDEDWNAVIKQLLISEKVFNADTLDPVTIVTDSLKMQSNLNDKMINYSLDIKKAYTYINTVN
jgi:hypothetical protein